MSTTDKKTDEKLEEVVDNEDTDLDDEEYESDDSLTFSNGVIEKVVALSLDGVPNIVGQKGNLLNRVQDVFGRHDMRQGITVEVKPDSSVKIGISVIMAYGAYAPDIFVDVKEAVTKGISSTTGLEVAGVDLRIEDVYTPDEIAAYQAKQLPAGNALAPKELPEGEEEPEIEE